VGGRGGAFAVPVVEVRELLAKDDCLHGVQAGGVTGQDVLVLVMLSVLAKRACRACDPFVIGHERACVAERAEVLRRIEAECGGAADGARSQAVAVCAVRLTRVFEDDKLAIGAPRGYVGDAAHVGHLTVHVNRQEESRARSHGGLRCLDVEVVVLLGNIDRNGDSTRLHDRGKGGDERVSREDHLVSRLEPGGDEAEPERVEPAGRSDAPRRADERSKGVFELPYGRAVDEGARLDEIVQGREQPLLERSMKTASELDERHLGHGVDPAFHSPHTNRRARGGPAVGASVKAP
jgi:hypothetical protein